MTNSEHAFPIIAKEPTNVKNKHCPRQRTEEGIDNKFFHVDAGKTSW